MNKKDFSRTPEEQYGAARKLEKGWIRLFTCGCDVDSTVFGHWTQKDFEDYLKILAQHFDDLNQPIETEDGILITAGDDCKPVCLFNKDDFSFLEDYKNK